MDLQGDPADCSTFAWADRVAIGTKVEGRSQGARVGPRRWRATRPAVEESV